MWTVELLSYVDSRSSFLEPIRAHQFDDPRLRVIHDRVLSGESSKEALD